MRRGLRHHLSTCGAIVLGLHLALAGTVSNAQAQAQQKKPAPKPAASAQPQPTDLIAKGTELFEDQEYEESVQTLSAALLRPSNTKEQKIEIYRLLALNYITLGRKAEADNAVRGLLVVRADYDLPATESPRFRDFFKEARAKWEAEGRPGLVKEKTAERPITLRHVSPSSAAFGKRIDLKATLDDPNKQVASVKLYYRAGAKGDYIEAPAEVDDESVRVPIPGTAVKPPLVAYYFEVLDAKGAVITSRGDLQAPLRIPVPEPESGGFTAVPGMGTRTDSSSTSAGASI